MEQWVQTIITIVCSVIASSGFWSYIQKKNDKNDLKAQMLRGLAHDRIISLASEYKARGWCTFDEYENLYDYLYRPYEGLNGNGSARIAVEEVKKLKKFGSYEDYKCYCEKEGEKGGF